MGFEDIAHHLSRAALLKHEAEEPGEASVVGHDESDDADDDAGGGETIGGVILANAPFPPEAAARWKARLEKASEVVYRETAVQTMARLAVAFAPGGQHHAIVAGDNEHASAHIDSLSVEETLVLAMSMYFAAGATMQLVPAVIRQMQMKMIDAESGH